MLVLNWNFAFNFYRSLYFLIRDRYPFCKRDYFVTWFQMKIVLTFFCYLKIFCKHFCLNFILSFWWQHDLERNWRKLFTLSWFANFMIASPIYSMTNKKLLDTYKFITNQRVDVVFTTISIFITNIVVACLQLRSGRRPRSGSTYPMSCQCCWYYSEE